MVCSSRSFLMSTNMTTITSSSVTKTSGCLLKEVLSHIILPVMIFTAFCSFTCTADSLTPIYGDDDRLGQTVAYKYLHDSQRKELQEDILDVLGLDHRPNPIVHEKTAAAPRFLLDVYEKLLDEESGLLKQDISNDIPVNPIFLEGEKLSLDSLRVINNSDKIVSFAVKHMKKPHHRKLLFDVSQASVQDEVMDAELRIFRSFKDSVYPRNWTYVVSIYQVVNEAKQDRKERRLKKLHSRKISPDDKGWLLFNVTQALTTWILSPKDNRGLVVRVRAPHASDSLAPQDLHPRDIGLLGFHSEHVYHDKQPFLLGFFKMASNTIHSKSPSHVKRRHRRQAKNRDSKSYWDDEDSWTGPENSRISSPLDKYHNSLTSQGIIGGRSCQKKTLYVNFKELRWQDWIIAPDGYAAYFCHGECSFPLSPHMNATNHAIVQTLVHLMNPEVVPKPCCAPNKLSAIMVLYFDDNSNVILKKYRNMVVKSCGCH